MLIPCRVQILSITGGNLNACGPSHIPRPYEAPVSALIVSFCLSWGGNAEHQRPISHTQLGNQDFDAWLALPLRNGPKDQSGLGICVEFTWSFCRFVRRRPSLGSLLLQAIALEPKSWDLPVAKKSQLFLFSLRATSLAGRLHATTLLQAKRTAGCQSVHPRPYPCDIPTIENISAADIMCCQQIGRASCRERV